MNYRDYQKDLNTILESELFGIALFQSAAKATRDLEQQKKWQALEALERQTLKRLEDFLKEARQQTKAKRHVRLKGKVLGYILAKLPWPIAMYLLKEGTQPFMRVFERLSQHADQPTKAFFDYVLAHEKSIYDFAEKELKKQYRDSLQHVNALLNSPLELR